MSGGVLGKQGDELAELRTDMKLAFAALKGQQAVVRWMLGFMLAMQVAVLFKVFTP